MNYTEEQRAIIDYRGGHALVGAVAGSGKSAALVGRVVSLLRDNVPASRILVLMYNTSAREAFDERLRRACAAGRLDVPDVFTYHAFGLRLCGRFEKAGLLPARRLEGDNSALMKFAREAVRRVNQELEEAEKIDPFGDAPKEMLSILDVVAGELGVIPATVPRNYARVVEVMRQIQDKEEFRVFGDLIADPVHAIRASEDAAQFAANRYDHILVDELQDANEAQICLLQMLAGSRAQVVGVGDDDQCIYAWRGAKPEYMVSRFSELFPGAVRLPLSRTFRFGAGVADAANRLIAHNLVRIQKTLVPEPQATTVIRMEMAEPWGRPGDAVVGVLKEWMAAGRPLSDAAILVREFALSVALEPALLAAGIPYRIAGSAPFFDRVEALALETHVRLACRTFPEDVETRLQLLRAALTQPTLYLPWTAIDKIAREASAAPEKLPALLRASAATFNDFRAKRLKNAADWFAESLAGSWSSGAGDFLFGVHKRIDLAGHILKQHPRAEIAKNRLALVNAVLDMARTSDTLATLLRRLDELRAAYASMDASASLVITSIHRAKGLEWPLVILPELYDSSFPAKSGSGELTPAEIEDERRLMYVAITRAKESLVLCCPMDPALDVWARSGKEGHPAQRMVASRFLYEIGKCLLPAP